MKPIKILPLVIILVGCSSVADNPPETDNPDQIATAETEVISHISSGTHEKTFANGMKVIVKEDHRAPVVISQVWYRVGSAQEHSGITGVSHVLEHMMFKGTEKYPSGTFSSTVAEIGARDNAFTGRDYTAYYLCNHAQ